MFLGKWQSIKDDVGILPYQPFLHRRARPLERHELAIQGRFMNAFDKKLPLHIGETDLSDYTSYISL